MSFCWRRIGLLAFSYLFYISSLFSSTLAILHILAFLKAMEINAMKTDLHYIHHGKTIQQQGVNKIHINEYGSISKVGV